MEDEKVPPRPRRKLLRYEKRGGNSEHRMKKVVKVKGELSHDFSVVDTQNLLGNGFISVFMHVL